MKLSDDALSKNHHSLQEKSYRDKSHVLCLCARLPASSISVTFFRLFIRTRTRGGLETAGKRSNRWRGKRKELCLLVWSPCSFSYRAVRYHQIRVSRNSRLAIFIMHKYIIRSESERSEQSADSTSFLAVGSFRQRHGIAKPMKLTLTHSACQPAERTHHYSSSSDARWIEECKRDCKVSGKPMILCIPLSLWLLDLLHTKELLDKIITSVLVLQLLDYNYTASNYKVFLS